MRECGLHGEWVEQERRDWENTRKEGLDSEDGCAFGRTLWGQRSFSLVPV